MLGRPIDTARETVRFRDGDKTNLDPDNIIVIVKHTRTVRTRLARLQAQQKENAARIELLQNELKLQASS